MNKFMIATVEGYVATQGANNFANMQVEMLSGGTSIDIANIEEQGSDLRDRTAALSWWSSTSTAKDVTIRTFESGDQVCLEEAASDLHLVY
jgi:hypothetical protein